MRQAAEGVRWKTAVICLAWAALVGAIAYPLYVWTADAYQALVIRLAAALALGIAILQVHTRVRRVLDGEPQSLFNLAAQPRERMVQIDPSVQKLHGELVSSVRSRRSFDAVLWPRLSALAERHGTTLRPPPTTWSAFRGPALSTIAQLLSSIERKS